MDIANAKAVISGGASGLGLETARRVVNAGGHAVLLDVNDEQGQVAVAELGERAQFVATDVTNEDAVRTAMQAAKAFMGGATLAVNCAGVATAGRTLGREGPWPADNFARVV
ncbi:MAG: SDR family NAD(P)-dependent oxidoreductase, partial [Pseudomonadota bacterium]